MNNGLNFPEPSFRLQLTPRCPHCGNKLELTEDGKCSVCGEQINDYSKNNETEDQEGTQ